MSRCDNCNKKLNLFTAHYRYKNGKIVNTYCSKCLKKIIEEHNKEEKEELKKKKQKIVEDRRKNEQRKVQERKNNLDLLKTLFEDELEKIFLIKLYDSIIWGGYYTKGNLVGYKGKIVKKLRELDIINKDRVGIYLNGDIQSYTGRGISSKIKKYTTLIKKTSNKRFICSTCEYKWESNKKFGDPAKCPRCNSSKIINFEELSKLIK